MATNFDDITLVLIFLSVFMPIIYLVGVKKVMMDLEFSSMNDFFGSVFLFALKLILFIGFFYWLFT